MYLLYTKKSTNPYSLLFSVLNMISSSMWITYSKMVADTPLMVRGTSDLFLFSVSTAYILRNRYQLGGDPSDINPYESNKVIPLPDEEIPSY
jgi:hypothetical protein